MAVKHAVFLALGHQGAHTGAHIKRRNAGATSAQLLGQRALRREFQLQFTGQVLALKLLVFAHVAGDHLADLARFQQLAQAKAVDTGVVGNHRQVFDAGVAQRVNQRLGNAAQAKATDGQQLTVLDDAFKRLRLQKDKFCSL